MKEQRPSKCIKKNKFTPRPQKIPAEKNAGIFLPLPVAKNSEQIKNTILET